MPKRSGADLLVKNKLVVRGLLRKVNASLQRTDLTEEALILLTERREMLRGLLEGLFDRIYINYWLQKLEANNLAIGQLTKDRRACKTDSAPDKS